MRRILKIASRECGILMRNPIHIFCMIFFPLLVIFFFTSLLDEGQPEDLPVGVVDHDNTSMTRKLIHRLDAFQSTKVVVTQNYTEELIDHILRALTIAFG